MDRCAIMLSLCAVTTMLYTLGQGLSLTYKVWEPIRSVPRYMAAALLETRLYRRRGGIAAIAGIGGSHPLLRRRVNEARSSASDS